MNTLSRLLVTTCLMPLSLFAKETVLPASFENNQIYLQPRLPDNSVVRFFTDTGGGWNAISNEVFTAHQLPSITKKGQGQTMELSVMPTFKEGQSIPKGGMNNFMQGHLFIQPKEKISPLGDIDGFLGGRWHAEKIIKFDYINHEMATYDKIEDIDLKKFEKIHIGFQKKDNQYTMAFPSIDIGVNGTNLPVLFDTGASILLSDEAKTALNQTESQQGTSYIVASIFEQWRKDNPSWQVIEKADKLSGEAMIKVPQVNIGSYTVGPVWFTRRADKNFHQYMSSMMDRKVDGAIGGSLLKYLAVVIDYPAEIGYIANK